jgi:hypothetical protein
LGAQSTGDDRVPHAAASMARRPVKKSAAANDSFFVE